MEDAAHILVVDDDTRLRELLHKYLIDQGFRVTTGQDAADARAKLNSIEFDLLIVDIMMPGESGLAFTQSLRQVSGVPILLLTAMSESEDRIRGLECGADDYLTKPFDFDELLARLEALARRAHNFAPSSNILQVADLVLDRDLLEVRRGEEVIKLTAKELAILELLMSAPGRVLSRTRILNQVWGYSEDPLTNVVDVYIARLRRKIDTEGCDPLINTVRGHGYRLRAPR